MQKFWKVLKRILLVLLVIVVIVGAGGAFYLKSYIPNTVAPKSFPQIDGEIKITGLDGPVDIYRDKMGIPHIYASSTHDLFFAQGYVHAQDRFWQMDFWRHIGSGRLSEMFGEGQVDTDSFLRTLGWRQVAEKEYQMLSPESKATIDSFTEGVNAYIQERGPIELSLEYLILTGVLNPDYKIEPWTPVNSLTWGKAMAWDLGGNMDDEIERAILLKTLTPEQLTELYPGYPEDYPVIVPAIEENIIMDAGGQKPNSIADFNSMNLNLQAVADKLKLMESALGPTGPDIGSNSWVVSGALTTTGKPFLANDMHLGIQMPSIWYQNSLHCLPKNEACPFDVTGFSFPGVPGVMAGHNDRVAWGFTNLGPDVQDLYIEKVNPENPDQYEVNGEWVDFEIRKETIKVGGGDPVELTVRISRHGPVISDTFGALKDNVDPEKNPEATPFKDKSGVELPENYVIALAWTALTPNSPFEAIWGFDKSQNWEEFRAAARMWTVPAQNLVYADVDGNIGYQTPGTIPIRTKGDGTLPVPGWTGEYEWDGYIPFDQLPFAFNPKSGFIVTANNQANPRDYPYLITMDWDYGQRAARIVDMIENAPAKIDAAYIQDMHGDSFDLNAEDSSAPPAGGANSTPESHSPRTVCHAQEWDYQETIDSIAADSHFRMVLEKSACRTLSRMTCPKAYWPGGGSRWYVIMRNLIQQPDSQWWDDKTTDKVETRDDMFVRAFEEAISQMQDEYGKDTSKWLPGAMYTPPHSIMAHLANQAFARSKTSSTAGRIRHRRRQGVVNATGWTVGCDGFEVTNWLPSEREIVDLSNLDNSLTIHTTGQSGHAYHPHYVDMAPLWAGVQYYPMWFDQESVIKDSEGHLKLVP